MFQFYPESAESMELITTSALQVGFGGGVVVDYPNSTKAKKYFLVLFAGTPSEMPQGLNDEPGARRPNTIQFTSSGTLKRPRSKKGKPVKDREWVQKKKDAMRQKGYKVASDSKYTCRRRKPKF